MGKVVSPMNESTGTSDSDLEQYRSYLYVLARAHLRPGMQRRIDASDIVQQTMIDAHFKREQFQGSSEQRAAWLRQILTRNLTDAIRHEHWAKRDCSREQPLDDGIDESFRRAEDWLHATQSSPSQAITRQEELLRLAEALAKLPDDQREAVVLRHLHSLSLAEVANQLERSPSAAAGLIYRGLCRLHELLDEPD